MRLFILLSLISVQAFALDWFDMDTDSEYTIQQNLSLHQKERSGSILEISKGEKFVLKDKVGMGMGLALFNFAYENCPGQQMETEVEEIFVDGTTPVIEVGAMVASGCELWVYVDLHDFWTKSLFE
ncbi:MAG: hypothetical protein ACJ76H_17340 [Bacteriovoracaceae bacterium]